MYSFFEHIAERKNKENDLSDFTWAMCMASDFFKIKFLNFFFPNETFDKNVIVKRECTGNSNSRVDFLIEIPDKEKYIIECKIYDRIYHFEQYAKDFKVSNKNMGFISNYKIHKEGFITKRWDELWDELFKALSDLPSDSVKDGVLIKSYLVFIEKVCNLNTINMNKKMSYKETFSVYNFTVMLKKSINKITIDGEYYLTCHESPYLALGVNGYYFNITFLGEKFIENHVENLFVGIYYDKPLENEFPGIWFLLEKTKIKDNIYSELKKNIENNKTMNELFNQVSEDEDGYWFGLSEETMEKYESQSIEKQSELIEKFITSVIDVSFNLKSKN